MALIMLRYIPCIHTLVRIFIMNQRWTLSSAFSASIEMIMSFLIFFLFMWVYDFIKIKSPCSGSRQATDWEKIFSNYKYLMKDLHLEQRNLKIQVTPKDIL